MIKKFNEFKNESIETESVEDKVTIPQEELASGYYLFGNKGSVWSDKVHIASSGSTTLCGTPMLSSNWARIQEIDHAGCPDCIAKYQEENK